MTKTCNEDPGETIYFQSKSDCTGKTSQNQHVIKCQDMDGASGGNAAAGECIIKTNFYSVK